MSELGERLERLGLSQYLEVFVAEGFDTWEIVLDITESDLSSLKVKLGHRRKLQRAIAEYRGSSSDRPLPTGPGKTASVDGSYRSGDESGPESRPKPGESSAAGTTTSTKRKYRRHPKPDEHAPERPPSAYVIFSNQVRETLKGQDLSFTEIAKVVGERWQVLPAEPREACERQANRAKEKYYATLAEYKKTPQYEEYQKYLEEFKAKHAAPQKGRKGKRTRLETETTTSTQSSGTLDTPQLPIQEERSSGRRPSLAQVQYPRHGWSESSPPVGPGRLPSGPSHPSKSASPAANSLSGFNSPRTTDHYSPISASPRSATLQKENSFESYSSAVARDARGQPDAGLPYPPSSYGAPQHQQPSTTPPTASYGAHYQPPGGLPSRRSMREMQRLPPLTHEDTTLSSDSGGQGQQSGYNAAYSNTPQTLLPIHDAPKMRMLPTPVLSMNATPSPLDRPPQPTASPPQPHLHPQQQQAQVPSHSPPDYRTNASLAALLRAGELARVADDEEMDLVKEGSP
ncbi:hypothetical protein CC80DRAFT_136122 [Byssothecium circinans]|uniref:HMG box domain-containing protein n=1 Tax=Byssothecium circinans TaxID=147558 RepID=A0A6A5TQM7_9PLEO|nr:hypothetical protein CC80DRAFT_136122 [Byssothecium circinans]